MSDDARYLRLAEDIRSAMGDVHVAIFLYGSHARGDFGAGSDIDLLVLGTRVDASLLARIGSRIRALHAEEINPWVVSSDEFRADPLALGAMKLVIEGRLLTGACDLPPIPRERFVEPSSRWATEAMMSCRHYQISGEVESLGQTKIRRFILKPLRHALRVARYVMDGVTLADPVIDKDYGISDDLADVARLHAIARDRIVANRSLLSLQGDPWPHPAAPWRQPQKDM